MSTVEKKQDVELVTEVVYEVLNPNFGLSVLKAKAYNQQQSPCINSDSLVVHSNKRR